jgi:hypothetical protein
MPIERQTVLNIEGIIERLAGDSAGPPPCMFTNEAGLTAVMAVRQLRDLLEDSRKPVRYAAYAFLQILSEEQNISEAELAVFEATPENAELIATFRRNPRPRL